MARLMVIFFFCLENSHSGHYLNVRVSVAFSIDNSYVFLTPLQCAKRISKYYEKSFLSPDPPFAP